MPSGPSSAGSNGLFLLFMSGQKTFVVDHLLGALKGSRNVLSGDQISIGSGADDIIHFPALSEPGLVAGYARIVSENDGYFIESESGMLVNGQQTHGRRLTDGDLIRLGSIGPLLRYRIIDFSDAIENRTRYKSMREVIDDCVDCAKTDSTSPITTGWRVLRSLPSEIGTQTSPGVRFFMVFVFVLLLGSIGFLTTRLTRLEQSMDTRNKEFASSLDVFQQDRTLSVGEIRELRSELSETSSRITDLESRSDDASGVIQSAVGAVAFIQGAYAFRDTDGQPLRLVIGLDGKPLLDSRGEPRPTVFGSGPIFEQHYTGTAFLVSSEGLFVTNHHVAEPWLFDSAGKKAIKNGLTPYMTRMAGYLPDSRTSFSLTSVAVGEKADVAVLRTTDAIGSVSPLELGDLSAELGQSILVLGYPTGIRALIARMDPTRVDSMIRAHPSAGFWEIAENLARAGGIEPLVTRGIVGQITSTSVVYDAETTHGGSGGPVLGLDGRVYAINTAIIEDFGGSNLGVPIEMAKILLNRAGLTDRQ